MAASYGDESPIAAFATNPGKSALTLIRCSGEGTVEMAANVFSKPEKLRKAAGNTVVHGWIVAAFGDQAARPPEAEQIDEVLVSVFRAPKSYTGEDGLDISCHGGGAAGRRIMEVLRAAGFRDALPGEFTFRAFMNGKLDLTRSEAVMEIVSSKTDAGRRRAVNRLFGVLEKEINEIKKLLVELLSETEIFLDYSEDEIDPGAGESADRFPGRSRAQEALARLKKLADSWRREQIYQEGILAVIAGRPNAGKSSLFNLLLREERSIVTEIPGTTRDWIEAWISIGDIPVRLADTAGLRDSSDPVEKIGVERSRELLERADLVLYLIDGAGGLTVEDHFFINRYIPPGTEQKPLLIIWNKADIAPVPSSFPFAANIPISAKTGKGITELTGAIALALENMTADDDARSISHNAALGSARQKDLVKTAIAALEEALRLAGRGEPLDLVAPSLREAVNALGEITGDVSTADILEEMFSRFCVGK